MCSGEWDLLTDLYRNAIGNGELRSYKYLSIHPMNSQTKIDGLRLKRGTEIGVD